MKNRWFLGLGVVLLIIACQIIPTPPSLTTTPPGTEIPEVGVPTVISDSPPTSIPLPTPTLQNEPPDLTGGLPPFPDPLDGGFSLLKPTTWEPIPYAGSDLQLPYSLDQAANKSVVEGLTLSQRTFLETNGFVVIGSQEIQFSDLRLHVAKQFGQPYYLSTDAAYYALVTNWNALVEALEREELYPHMLAITQSVYDELITYLPFVQGTAIEQDALLATAYMGVALRLFDPQAVIDPGLALLIEPQVRQIQVARGFENSELIPGYQDDFSLFKPNGHYSYDPLLENYFRAMTWYARVHFSLTDSGEGIPPSKAPLLITLALRRADTSQDMNPTQTWRTVNEVLAFLKGKTPYDGPPEYAGLMDQVYGPRVTLIGLADEPTWLTFQALAGELPIPSGRGSFSEFYAQANLERGWRFMGIPFDTQEFIFDQLLYDRVSDSGNRRDLPTGLDMMAVLGSSAAVDQLENQGEFLFRNYREQLGILQRAVQAQPDEEWLSDAFGTWMHAINAQVLPSPDATARNPYPAYMRTYPWEYRILDGALGSWISWEDEASTEYAHSTVQEAEEKPTSSAVPCYVEPLPQVYYSLAYLAGALVDGLEQRDLTGEESNAYGLNIQSIDMLDLADRLNRLGDITVKELTGETLTASDCALVEAPLGAIESRVYQSQLLAAQGSSDPADLPTLPTISTVRRTEGRVLQAGIGLVNRMYVLIPWDEEILVAQGPVVSFYEFVLPEDDEVDDQGWQQVVFAEPPESPSWTQNFIMPGGTPLDVLAFRLSDIYRITLSAGQLGLRAEPDVSMRFIHRLSIGDYLEIVDGPIQANGFTWWKFRRLDTSGEIVDGWAPENADWFERAWGQ